MYIVAAPSKSGTTSFFKLLTDNNILPAIQTHDFWHFNVHDRYDGGFTKYMQENHPDCITHPTVYDYGIQNKDIYSYYIILKNDMKHDFFEYVEKHAKILKTIRDPYSRSVSAFIHWCQYKQVLNEMEKEPTNQKPLDFLLKSDTSNMKFDLMINMVEAIKKEKKLLDIQQLAELFESYFFIPGRLLAEYKFLDYMLDTHIQNPMGLKKIDISLYNKEELLEFLELPKSTIIPRERDRHSCKEYIFSPDVDEVYEYLLEMVRYIELDEEDSQYLKKNFTLGS